MIMVVLVVVVMVVVMVNKPIGKEQFNKGHNIIIFNVS